MTFTLTDLLEFLDISELELKRFALRSERFYREFESEKKSGGTRTIVAPTKELKAIQRKISNLILKRQEVHDACNGYRKGRSIVSNARPHIGQDFVFNMDLKNFFPSISFNRVLGLFQSLECDRDVALLLTRLTTYKGELPQGAPSSPFVANLICRRLDNRLDKFCQIRNWNYTRYCDDITISGAASPASARKTIAMVIESEGFEINESKTRVKYKHQQQSVTGIVVNEKLSIPRARRRQLRAACHQMQLDPESFRGSSDRILGQLTFANMVEGILEQENFQDALELLLETRRQAKLVGSSF